MSFDVSRAAQPAHDRAFNLSDPSTNSLADFVSDLRASARDLIDDIEESRPTALALFKGTAAQLYPACRDGTAWRGHRCPVTRDDLERAGYRQYAALFSFGRDPFRLLVGPQGELPLGTERWLRGNWYEPESVDCFHPQSRAPRAAFFLRLADVLESRS